MEIDREKVCPCLVRCFWKIGGSNSVRDYDRDRFPKLEAQIYTWKDATLREITDLLKDIVPEIREGNVTLDFSIVYIDRNGDNVLRKVGKLNSNGSFGGKLDESKTLQVCGFEAGDCIDISINVQAQARPFDRRNNNFRRGGGSNKRPW